MPPIDSAILAALSLTNSDDATLKSHGGSSFTSTYKLTVKDDDDGGDGTEKCYFLKTGKGENAKAMFAGNIGPLTYTYIPILTSDGSDISKTGEHTSLNALHTTIPTLSPKSISHGPLSSSPNSYFLLTDFLAPSRSHSSNLPPKQTLAYKLAHLHSITAPIPSGHSTPKFGFPLPTYCGNTPQTNTYHDNWADFYSNCRIRPIFGAIEKNQGEDKELGELVNVIVEVVTPRLLRNGHLTTPDGEDIKPVLVHGDLWSGNHGAFSHDGGKEEEMIFDPSSCYAHSEFEFGIMKMFGGFGSSSFEDEYYKYKDSGKGRDRPVSEWEDRVRLYEL